MSEVIIRPLTPLYVSVRQQILDQISSSQVGDKLKPERGLSDEFGVDRDTVRRAMQDLEREGFVVRQRGRGTFITKTTDPRVANTDKSQLIGLVLPNLDIFMNLNVIKGIQRAATKQGRLVVINNSEYSNERERQIIRDLMRQDLAGVLILPFDKDSFDSEYGGLIRQLRDTGKRVVLLDTYNTELDVPCVMCNKVRMGYMATEHLVMLGHERICFACPGSYDTSGRDSLRGYKMALRDYDIEFDEKLTIDIPVFNSAIPVHDAVVEKLTNNRKAFTALAAPWFSFTYGAIKALDDLGLRVPDDIALVGGDVDENPSLSYVTHVAQPWEKIGSEAFSLLMRDDPNDESMKRNTLLQPRLVIGTTCGAKV